MATKEVRSEVDVDVPGGKDLPLPIDDDEDPSGAFYYERGTCCARSAILAGVCVNCGWTPPRTIP